MMDAAEQLRTLLRQAGSEPDLAEASARLLHLLEQALEDAHDAGSRSVARAIPHELGQPLAEVRGYAELLLERDFSEEQTRDLLSRIAGAAIRLGELAHGLGALAESDAPARVRRLPGHEPVQVPGSAASGTGAALLELQRSALRRLETRLHQG